MDYKGKLLVAKPIFSDMFFSRTVVFIAEDSNDGTIGFILNKKSDVILSEIIPDIHENMDIYIGGPVNQNHLFVFHKRPDIINGINIVDNYYWSEDFDNIKSVINNKLIKSDEIRFFLGYSGWGTDQLKGEIKNKDWIIYSNHKINLFEENSDIWKKELIKIDKRNIIWMNSPSNPELN